MLCRVVRQTYIPARPVCNLDGSPEFSSSLRRLGVSHKRVAGCSCEPRLAPSCQAQRRSPSRMATMRSAEAFAACSCRHFSHCFYTWISGTLFLAIEGTAYQRAQITHELPSLSARRDRGCRVATMLCAGLAYALDALGRPSARRHAAVHPASAIRHGRRSARRALASASAAAGRVVGVPGMPPFPSQLRLGRRAAWGVWGHFRPRPLV